MELYSPCQHNMEEEVVSHLEKSTGQGGQHWHGDDCNDLHGEENDEMNGDIIDAEEKEHYEAVIGSMAFYPIASTQQWKRLAFQFSQIPIEHRRLLSAASNGPFELDGVVKEYMAPSERIQKLNKASQVNTQFLKIVVDSTGGFLNHLTSTPTEEIIWRPTQPQSDSRNPLSVLNAEKVYSTIYQLAREWSCEGQIERDATFLPLLLELQKRLPIPSEDLKYKYKVFCPGSGLGRLPLEICMKGYCSVANEFSYFMLIMSNFMLNKTKSTEQYTIYPWIHQLCNVKNASEQLQAVKIPDMNPNDLPSNADFGCAAGDFLDIARSETGQWDAVVTCFFLDTANNVIEYMEAIYGMLKPGGFWINLGPLLYHYAEMSGELSLELSLDQVLHVAKGIGFKILDNKTIPCQYTRKRSSMMQVTYQAEFWSAQKP